MTFIHMQSYNHPAAPDSSELSRLIDLIELHQAIAALGQPPDYSGAALWQ